MNWFTNVLTSSIGRKLVMSFTGLFLIVFLIVHLMGNLQLLLNDGGKQFNLYALFMTTNPLIKTISYLLYLSIIVHAIQGILIWRRNRIARGIKYAARNNEKTTFASRNMAGLGIVIFVFIVIHMWQFWFQMKIGALDLLEYPGHEYLVKDLYTPVAVAFRNLYFVVFYVVSMVVIAFHLNHGFHSAFQTLGLNHRKYTPLIKWIGLAYSIIVPLAFAWIPVYFFFTNG
jgi:succinate dehydrogenase / fumarate reductase cytochrome b subunit